MRTRVKGIGAAFVASLTVACANAPGDDAASESSAALDSKLVAALSVGESAVELRELSSGHVLLTETHPIERPGPATSLMRSFDPRASSFTEYFTQLGSQATPAWMPTPDEVERLRSLDAKFAQRSAPMNTTDEGPRQVDAVTSALQLDDVESGERRWNDFNTDPNFAGDFDWFKDPNCFDMNGQPVEVCETGMHDWQSPSLYGYLAQATLFNESFDSSDIAELNIRIDPCEHWSTFPPSPCTSGLRSIYQMQVGGRHVWQSALYDADPDAGDDGKIHWNMYTTGSHFGWALDVQ